MSARRKAAAVAAVGIAPLALSALAAAPASAHGTMGDPVSRVSQCYAEGPESPKSAACKAAVAAGGTQALYDWNGIRIGDANGQHQALIPDGKLCSGGLPAYKGLDLARADFPSTRLTPGASFTLAYSSTIPHTGSFKLFLTKPGYDPTRPLRWSDLPTQPFATATDPALVDGAYRIRAKLPSGRTGRQMLFTIWQNTSTTDTYYSCSDVVLSGAPAASTPTRSAAAARKTGTPAGSGSTHTHASSPSSTPSRTSKPEPSDSPSLVTSSPTESAGTDHLTPAADSTSGGGSATLPLAAGGAAALLLTAGVAVTLRRRR
ncbi:lytic polysaccharide monooxygenase [Streptomyces sp. NPDC127574]|uniref:lytic polysaccharide monooxygenase auxiliary activity family 9 protein n=1 Tax=Streptomyces sp. NPDC127574 TaxID=3345401 RepID=UPI0036408DD0